MSEVPVGGCADDASGHARATTARLGAADRLRLAAWDDPDVCADGCLPCGALAEAGIQLQNGAD
jgi:hypothetical protein